MPAKPIPPQEQHPFLTQEGIVGDVRSPNFDLEALKTFFVVARLRSFSAAAEKLHKTPAAISYRIRSLEEQVGAPLFQRSTRKVILLPAGEHLIERTLQIYELLNSIPAELHQVNLGVEPKFTLVINNLLYDADATARLAFHLYRRFSQTRFAIRRAVYMGVWDQMLTGHADFAIGAPSWHPIDENFETHAIGEIHWRFVVSPSHPLTREKEPLDNEQLRHFPAINVEDTSVNLSKRVAWILPGQAEILVPNLHTKLACHLLGLGVGFLPDAISRHYIDSGQLVAKKVRYGRTQSPMSIAWRKNSAGKIADHLRTLFQEKDDAVHPFLQGLSVQN